MRNSLFLGKVAAFIETTEKPLVRSIRLVIAIVSLSSNAFTVDKTV